jgi:DNA topoisomerase-1
MELIIAEKQIAARRIADILSGGKAKQANVEGIPVYEFQEWKIIGLSGHITGIDFPEEYTRWTFDFSKLIHSVPRKIPLQKKYIKALELLAKDASSIVIATDYDREGELIGVEAIEIIKRANPRVRIKRARYSAITLDEIKRAFLNLTEVDYNLASACEARQIIDLVWGAALTRFVSLASGSLGEDFLSVGRVQSPTLALVVEREKEIERFSPRKYWEIHAHFGSFAAKHATKFWDKKEADSLSSSLPEKGEVVDLKKMVREEPPLSPFNTTEFLRSATSLGFSAGNAMRIAEELYMSGYISYPRTDNTVFPELDFRSLLRKFERGEFRQQVESILKKERLIPARGKVKATDHPPIYPVEWMDRDKISKQNYRIYELILRRFLSLFEEPSVVERTSAKIKIGNEIFYASGVKLLKDGWRKIYPYAKVEEKFLPYIKIGDTLSARIGVEEKSTKPPPRYTQGQLIKRMEDLGLGTKSTRHEILSKLYERGYIHGKHLRPTKKASAVIDSLKEYADSITKPDMTRELEKDMDEIASGTKGESEVVDESRAMLDSIFRDLLRDKKAISASLKDKMRERIGACPSCGSQLWILRSKYGKFIGCSSFPKCNFSIPLPKGKIEVLKEKCEQHGLQLVKVKLGGKKWTQCAYCSFLEWKSQSSE